VQCDTCERQNYEYEYKKCECETDLNEEHDPAIASFNDAKLT
jgi:hypothetical protein